MDKFSKKFKSFYVRQKNTLSKALCMLLVIVTMFGYLPSNVFANESINAGGSTITTAFVDGQEVVVGEDGSLLIGSPTLDNVTITQTMKGKNIPNSYEVLIRQALTLNNPVANAEFSQRLEVALEQYAVDTEILQEQRELLQSFSDNYMAIMPFNMSLQNGTQHLPTGEWVSDIITVENPTAPFIIRLENAPTGAVITNAWGTVLPGDIYGMTDAVGGGIFVRTYTTHTQFRIQIPPQTSAGELTFSVSNVPVPDSLIADETHTMRRASVMSHDVSPIGWSGASG